MLVRETSPAMQELVVRANWQLVAVIPLSAQKVFSGTGSVHALGDARHTFQKPVQAIGIFTLLTPAEQRSRPGSLARDVAKHEAALLQGLDTVDLPEPTMTTTYRSSYTDPATRNTTQQQQHDARLPPLAAKFAMRPPKQQARPQQ